MTTKATVTVSDLPDGDVCMAVTVDGRAVITHSTWEPGGYLCALKAGSLAARDVLQAEKEMEATHDQ